MEHSIIDTLIMPDDGIHEQIKYNKRYEKFDREANDLSEELAKTLNDEQKEKLNKLIDLYMAVECEASETYFKAGVKVGVRFVAESMFD